MKNKNNDSLSVDEKRYLRNFYAVTKPNPDTILGLTVLATELPLGTHNLYTEDFIAHKEKELSAKVQKLIDEVEYHKQAYGLDIFPNSAEINSESTRESVSAFMGRHMCNAFLMYINSIFNFQKEGSSK